MRTGRKQKEAIAALLAQPSVAQAARVAGIGHQTLLRWMKNQEFKAAYKAARRAEYRQSTARLRQGATAAASTILKIMVDPRAKPATRLNAAMVVLDEAQDAIEMEDFDADLAEVERATKASQAEAVRLPTHESGRSRIAGHGAKFPRRKEKAVAALLTQRSVAEAARVAGIGTQTLDRWMEDREFNAAYLAAARAAFGPAMILLQRGVSAAVSIVQNFAADPGIPEATRLKAAVYVYHYSKAVETKDWGTRLAEVEPASDENSEPGGTSKMIGRNLHQRLQRLKARLAPANWNDEFEYVHAADGRAAGSSVIGPDGRHVWLQPPEGYREGEPVPDREAT
ncbi:MAG: transposase family protein [Bryobacteraceae bacterium]|jgi:transposase-like protein